METQHASVAVSSQKSGSATAALALCLLTASIAGVGGGFLLQSTADRAVIRLTKELENTQQYKADTFYVLYYRDTSIQESTFDIFTDNGKEYYMPWESTVCISGKWFYNTTDTTYKSIEELVKLYQVATAQDNILILNCPPNREGKIREKDIEILMALRKRIETKP